MKVAVSIPDRLLRRAERLAERARMSRSQLYAVALERHVDLEDDDRITRRLDAVYGARDSRLDAGLVAAQAEAVRERW
ncbi:MAG: ChpI protein [bacterium]|nr:ChpI protein [bacterium]